MSDSELYAVTLLINELLSYFEQHPEWFTYRMDDRWSDDDDAEYIHCRTFSISLAEGSIFDKKKNASTGVCMEEKPLPIVLTYHWNKCALNVYLGSTYFGSNNTCNQEYVLGWGPENKDVKIPFFKLWHKVKNYNDVFLKQKEQEEFEKELMKRFPSIFDHLLLGEDNEEG